MKILFVSDAVSMHTRRWVEYFRDRGHEVHIASFRPANIGGVQIHVLPTYGLGKVGYLLAAPKLRGLFKRIKPDVVHAQYVSSYGFLAAFARLKPLVLTAWGTDILISPWQSRLMHFFASYATRHADALNTVAEHMNASFYRLGAAPGTVEAFPFGVDAQFFHPNSQYQPSEPVRIISTRNFAPVYSVHTFVEALGRLRKSGVTFTADIVGDGPLRADIEAKVKSLGLTEQVRFHGHVSHEQLRDLLAGADIFVTTALSDGNNVSLNEAMACGCFPIATRIPANEQWIEQRSNGLLFSAGNEAELADAIREAVGMQVQWPRIRAENRQIIELQADWRVCTAKMEDVYRRVIQA